MVLEVEVWKGEGCEFSGAKADERTDVYEGFVSSVDCVGEVVYLEFPPLAGHSYQLEGKAVPKEECSHFAIADTALSDRRTADYTVIGMFALTPDKDLLWLERWRGRYSGPDQVKLIR